MEWGLRLGMDGEYLSWCGGPLPGLSEPPEAGGYGGFWGLWADAGAPGDKRDHDIEWSCVRNHGAGFNKVGSELTLFDGWHAFLKHQTSVIQSSRGNMRPMRILNHCSS